MILCSQFIGIAQTKHGHINIDSTIFKNENSQLTINSNILLAGESLLYKVYNFNDSKKLSSLSKIIYISLRNEKDSIIFNDKIALKQGIGNGSLFIPANLKTGNYKLVGYTMMSLNNKENSISQKNIYIINPFSKSHKNNLAESEKSNTIQFSFNDKTSDTPQNTVLKTNKKIYEKREKINLSISNLNEELLGENCALSVRKVNAVSIIDPVSKIENLNIENDDRFYIPELRGEIISGIITTSHNDLSISNQRVALSIKGKKYIFKTAITDVLGRFFFSINEPYTTENCIIQLLDSDSNNYNITLDKKVFHLENRNITSNIYLNSNLKDHLQERSVQIQLQNAYFDRTNVEFKENVIYEPFYGRRGYKYILDEYTRFSTFKETCVEIVTTIKTKEENDNVIFEVFDPFSGYKESPFSNSSPLILMDGIVILDPMEVYSYNTKNIESILVFPRPYRYGASVFQGIIDIKTKNGDFKPNLYGRTFLEFELESLSNIYPPYNPDYSKNDLERIPDYRVQLCWLPNIELDSNTIEKEFYGSDVSGTYEIVLDGYSSNGNYIRYQTTFDIK